MTVQRGRQQEPIAAAAPGLLCFPTSGHPGVSIASAPCQSFSKLLDTPCRVDFHVTHTKQTMGVRVTRHTFQGYQQRALPSFFDELQVPNPALPRGIDKHVGRRLAFFDGSKIRSNRTERSKEFNMGSIYLEELSAVGAVRFPDLPIYQGFGAPSRLEADLRDCEVTYGEVPKDLNGILSRCGPDRQYPPMGGDDIFIDGEGMVISFRFDNGHVDFRSRYVKTARYQLQAEHRRALFGRYRNRYARDPLAKQCNPG